MGKLAGGFIDVYLLEKSRVTYQQPNERGYHIFFQLVEEGPVPGLQELCAMTTDPYDYFFCSQGKVKVESIVLRKFLSLVPLQQSTLVLFSPLFSSFLFTNCRIEEVSSILNFAKE